LNYRGHQAKKIILHTAIGRRCRLSGALFFVVDHQADVVFSGSRFCADMALSPGADPASMQRLWTIERKFSVPYEYRTEGTESAARL
jgi:hypothetical protein